VRRHPALIAATLSLALVGCADHGRDSREILQGERDWGQAFVTGDAATVERLLAVDFSGVGSDGVIYDKARMLSEVRQGPNLMLDTLGAVTIRFYGATAIAQGREHEVGPPPQRAAHDSVWTDVWVRRNGRWRIEAAEDLTPKAP
jgi:Domain of unknown function (DUF4440)